MGKSVKNRHDDNGTYVKYGGDSNKKDKKIANKKFRRLSKVNIENEDKLPIDLKEVSNVWSFASDGLAHYVPFNSDNKYVDEDILRKLKRK